MRHEPEPWMRGPIEGVHPLLSPLLYSFQMAREDLDHFTEGLTADELWAEPFGLAAAGFHMFHIVGSTERLMTYLRGEEISKAQVADLAAERNPPRLERTELLHRIADVFTRAEATVRGLDPAAFSEPRFIGRKRLPSTVIGILTHLAEHTQRHVGQAVSAAKLARASAATARP